MVLWDLALLAVIKKTPNVLFRAYLRLCEAIPLLQSAVTNLNGIVPVITTLPENLNSFMTQGRLRAEASVTRKVS